MVSCGLLKGNALGFIRFYKVPRIRAFGVLSF